MKLSAISKKELAKIIIGESAPKYRTGPDLVDLFNDFFEKKDAYFQGFPSRLSYAYAKIEELNGCSKLELLIEEVFHIVHFDNILKNLTDVVNNYNRFITKDGYFLEIISKSHSLRAKVNLLNHELVDFKSVRITHEFINEQTEKCKKKLTSQNPDIDGAITNARSLVEAVMEFVLSDSGCELQHDGDLPKLFKEIKKRFNFFPEAEMDDIFKQCMSGLYSIITGLAGLSNKMSDRHSRQYNPLAHHGKLAVNSAFTFCDFLLSAYEYTKQNLQEPT
jgi:hypothetical protein